MEEIGFIKILKIVNKKLMSFWFDIEVLVFEFKVDMRNYVKRRIFDIWVYKIRFLVFIDWVSKENLIYYIENH